MKFCATSILPTGGAMLLTALLCVASMKSARADDWAVISPYAACMAVPTTQTISLGNVSIAANAANGPIGTAATVSMTFDCSDAVTSCVDNQNWAACNETMQTGDLAGTPTNAGSGGILYATNLQGISVLLTATSNQADAGGGGPSGVQGWELGSIYESSCDRHRNRGRWEYSCPSLTATFTAQLVKTGAIATGTVTLTAPLAYFTNYSSGNTNSAPSFASLSLSPVTVTAAGCSVDAGSQDFTVALPTALSSQFSGVGSTAGATPFDIHLTCDANVNVKIKMDTNNPDASHAGVVAPSGAGYASGIGVRIRHGQSPNTPVDFGTWESVSNASPSGPLTIPYSAQYFQTASPVSGGAVKAIVTFTMLYE